MKHSEIVTKLSDMVKKAGSQKAVAEALGITQPYLSELLRGTRTPGPAVLKALGMVKETTYREESNGEQ